MATWLMVSALVSAAAALVVAVYSVRLWRVNRLLVLVQAKADSRNNAILECRAVNLPGTATGPKRGIRFCIRNKGLKDTHIFDCFLEHTGPMGPERTELVFRWHKRDYRGHKMGNDLYTKPIPFHFIGERLESGQLWDVEARPVGGRSIHSYQDSRLIIVPALGDPLKWPADSKEAGGWS